MAQDFPIELFAQNYRVLAALYAHSRKFRERA